VNTTRSLSYRSRLALVSRLTAQLKQANIAYCHWKSNHRIGEFLQGAGDLDLLVSPDDSKRFRAIIDQLGFLPAAPPALHTQPAVAHYYGYDVPSGRFVHLHVYYRLVTGGLVVKDYELPFAEDLLEGRDSAHGIPTPPVAAECQVFLIRKMLEAASWTERLLLRRSWPEVRSEWSWLRNGGDQGGDHSTLLHKMTEIWHRRMGHESSDWIPQAIQALDNADWRQAARVGKELQHMLKRHRLSPTSRLTQSRAIRFAWRALRRMTGRPNVKRAAGKGGVIALVGCDGSGKTSTVSRLLAALSGHFDVRVLHMGRPGAMRWIVSWSRRRRSPSVRAASTDRRPTDSVLRQAGRCALAWYRLAAARQAHRWAQQGVIVLCDRYPSLSPGMDGPTESNRIGSSPIHRWLAKLEARLYQQLPPADAVIELTVPLEILHARLQTRGDRLDEQQRRLLLARLMQVSSRVIPSQSRFAIDASDSQEEMAKRVMTHLWHILCRQNTTRNGRAKPRQPATGAAAA